MLLWLSKQMDHFVTFHKNIFLVPIINKYFKGDKIPIGRFLAGDKMKTLKNFLSPCDVNISHGDKIPNCWFLDRDKMKTLKIFLSPCFINIYNGDMIPKG